jgi:hypothetical protein
LGFIRHQTFIPWDDDLDVHTCATNREYLLSETFAKDVDEIGLEAIYLRGLSSLDWATKEGAAVRLRFKNTYTPTIDVFFEVDTGEDMVKIDSWKNRTDYQLSTKEIFKKSDLYPLKWTTVDDIELFMPNNPKAMLEQQYGPSALTTMKGRHCMFSHQFPFQALNMVWKTKL